MARIICDTYYKKKKPIWDLDPDNPSTQAFNKRIIAVNAMYGWLYDQGILEKVAFEFKDYSDMTFFALDVKSLHSYREEMSKTDLPDAELAIANIFDREYTPCLYSGAIQLGWTMRTYRYEDGTVSRSWECDLVDSLAAHLALDVLDIRDKQGEKAAVSAVFAFTGFLPEEKRKPGWQVLQRIKMGIIRLLSTIRTSVQCRIWFAKETLEEDWLPF